MKNIIKVLSAIVMMISLEASATRDCIYQCGSTYNSCLLNSNNNTANIDTCQTNYTSCKNKC
jgi:hypothetical protein